MAALQQLLDFDQNAYRCVCCSHAAAHVPMYVPARWVGWLQDVFWQLAARSCIDMSSLGLRVEDQDTRYSSSIKWCSRLRRKWLTCPTRCESKPFQY